MTMYQMRSNLYLRISFNYWGQVEGHIVEKTKHNEKIYEIPYPCNYGDYNYGSDKIIVDDAKSF